MDSKQCNNIENKQPFLVSLPQDAQRVGCKNTENKENLKMSVKLLVLVTLLVTLVSSKPTFDDVMEIYT